jgi:hypothetical protein
MSKQNAVLRPLGIAIVLAVGFEFAIGLLALWGIAIYGELGGTRNYEWEQILILKDGTPIIYHYAHFDGTSKSNYRTLEGKELPEDMVTYEAVGEARLAGPDDFKNIHNALEGRNRIRSENVLMPQLAYWYFVFEGNGERGYFVGYDDISKRCIGYLGRNGASQQTPGKEDQFKVEGSKYDSGFLMLNPVNVPMAFLISGNHLLEVNLQSLSITTLVESPDIISLCLLPVEKAMRESLSSDDLIENTYVLTVRLPNRILLFDAGGKQVRSFVLPDEGYKGAIEFYLLGDSKAVLSYIKTYDKPGPYVKILWIDSSGNVLRRDEVALKEMSYIRPSQLENRELALAIPAPMPAAIVGTIANKKWRVDFSSAAKRYLSDSWQVLLALGVVSVILAGFCYRQQRRMALPWTWVWVVFVFLFGLPGFLAYRFHRRWPVLDSCHVCGHAVPHDREKCSSCGSEFPAPAPKGIEVFA